MTARGNRIEVRLNDEAAPIISLTDDRWTSGQAGVRMYTTDNDRAVSAFDNVRVTPLPPPPRRREATGGLFPALPVLRERVGVRACRKPGVARGFRPGPSP